MTDDEKRTLVKLALESGSEEKKNLAYVIACRGGSGVFQFDFGVVKVPRDLALKAFLAPRRKYRNPWFDPATDPADVEFMEEPDCKELDEWAVGVIQSGHTAHLPEDS